MRHVRLLLLLPVIFAFALAGTSSADAATVPEQRCHDEPAQLRRLRGAQLEISFMNHMIAHHESALEMAELALSHSSTPQVVELAENIIEMQTGEIAMLTDWLSTWYGEPARPVMDPCSMRQEHHDMMRLEQATGVAFDALFLRLMIRHHGMAIRMAATIPGRAVHPELCRMAIQVVMDQSREIVYMLSLLRGIRHQTCIG